MAGCEQGDVQVWLALSRAKELLDDHLDRALRTGVDLSLHEHSVLVQLALGGGIQQMNAVAQSLVLSKSGATRLVAKLEEEGLIERVVFPQDRRATFARLTDAGRSRLERSEAIFHRVLGEVFSEHLRGSDLQHLRRSLDRLLAGNGWVAAPPCPSWASDAAAPQENTTVLRP